MCRAVRNKRESQARKWRLAQRTEPTAEELYEWELREELEALLLLEEARA